MAGLVGRPPLPLEVHRQRGTVQPVRHLRDPAATPSPPPVISPAERRRALAGLPPEARRIATALLDQYGDWHAAALSVLRAYALSTARLRVLERAEPVDVAELRRETRCHLSLLRALDLER
jgi:hypothetical protein